MRLNLQNATCIYLTSIWTWSLVTGSCVNTQCRYRDSFLDDKQCQWLDVECKLCGHREFCLFVHCSVPITENSAWHMESFNNYSLNEDQTRLRVGFALGAKIVFILVNGWKQKIKGRIIFHGILKVQEKKKVQEVQISVCINKVLLAHVHTHSHFVYDCFLTTKAELSCCKSDLRAYKG